MTIEHNPTKLSPVELDRQFKQFVDAMNTAAWFMSRTNPELDIQFTQEVPHTLLLKRSSKDDAWCFRLFEDGQMEIASPSGDKELEPDALTVALNLWEVMTPDVDQSKNFANMIIEALAASKARK